MGTLDYHTELVEKCKRGDRSSQYNLYRLYAKGMFSICLRMLDNEIEAEDTLQESFMDVFSKIGTYKAEATPGAWIKRIVVNNCINKLKKRKMYFEEIVDDKVAIEEPVNLDDGMMKVNLIKKALQQLPDGYRIIFTLYAFEGYDHQEISEIMNVSESTSKSQYHRAKNSVKKIIKSMCQ